MTFAIAANIRKATIADAYTRDRAMGTIWSPELDKTIIELACLHHLAEACRIIGLGSAQVKRRAAKLGVTFLAHRQANEPTPGEWIHYATREAIRAGLKPKLVLGGYRRLPETKARWRAWQALHEAHPEYSIAGIARVSGHHHVTVLRVLEKLSSGLSAAQ